MVYELWQIQFLPACVLQAVHPPGPLGDFKIVRIPSGCHSVRPVFVRASPTFAGCRQWQENGHERLLTALLRFSTLPHHALILLVASITTATIISRIKRVFLPQVPAALQHRVVCATMGIVMPMIVQLWVVSKLGLGPRQHVISDCYISSASESSSSLST